MLVTGNANEANFNLQLQLKNTYTSWARGALVGGVGGEGGGGFWRKWKIGSAYCACQRIDYKLILVPCRMFRLLGPGGGGVGGACGRGVAGVCRKTARFTRCRKLAHDKAFPYSHDCSLRRYLSSTHTVCILVCSFCLHVIILSRQYMHTCDSSMKVDHDYRSPLL